MAFDFKNCALADGTEIKGLYEIQPKIFFGKYYGVILDAEKQNMFYIPEGFAHSFYVLSDEAIFTYKCTDFYDPKGEGGLMWNDSAIAIDWESVAPDVNPLLSDKNGKHPAFDAAKNYFDLNGMWIGA